jgi:hypothetical protein
MHSLFPRNFALEYIPKFQKAVWDNILKSPDSNIRNFNGKKMDEIYTKMGELLKRVYSIG